MKLELGLDLARRYKSPAQRTRVLTQAWVGENMYCPSCKAERLEQTPEGKRVVDFVWLECSEPFQLKSKKGKFGGSVVDAAYKPMVDAIEDGRVPSFLFLNYTLDSWRRINIGNSDFDGAMPTHHIIRYELMWSPFDN